MESRKINLFKHYRKLWFFAFNRFKNNNYQLMREYFAQVLIKEIEEFVSVWNRKVLDVGGAKGEFCKVISKKRKCDAVNLDPYPGQYIWPRTVTGFADNMPFDDNQFDIVICREVLEHIPAKIQQQSINEMYRVTKLGGVCYIVIPPWYSPFAGHGLKPFHILPFKIAKYLRELIFRKKISAKSFKDFRLYKITFGKMLKMITLSNFKLIAMRDTHLRIHFLTKIPIIREVVIPAAAFILKKK